MKLIKIILGLFFLTWSGCEYDSHFMHPNCTDGIKNGNETGLDCGGDCIRCWECGAYCELLAGESSQDEPCFKIWNSEPPDISGYNGIAWQNYYIYNTGEVITIGEYAWDEDNIADTTYGYWTFDDPSQPQKIGFNFRFKPKSLDDYHFNNIFMLKPDSVMWEIEWWRDPGPYYFLLVRDSLYSVK